MISRIKNFIRRNTKYGKSRYLNFLHRYDMKQFLEYSCMNENEHEQLATKIRILVHAIEKGMSLPSCRPGFGKEKVSIFWKIFAIFVAFIRRWGIYKIRKP